MHFNAMQRLPNDILLMIAQFFEPYRARDVVTLKSLRRVNKFCHAIASEILYRVFTLSNCLEAAERKVSFFAAQTNLPRYIKKLDIHITSLIPRDDLERMSYYCENSYICDDEDGATFQPILRDEIYEYPGLKEEERFTGVIRDIFCWVEKYGDSDKRLTLRLDAGGCMTSHPFRNSRWDVLFFSVIDKELSTNFMNMLGALHIVAVEPRDLKGFGESGIMARAPNLTIEYLSSGYHPRERSAVNSDQLQELVYRSCRNSATTTSTRRVLSLSGKYCADPIILPENGAGNLQRLKLENMVIAADSLLLFLHASPKITSIHLSLIRLHSDIVQTDTQWGDIFGMLVSVTSFFFYGLCYHDSFPGFTRWPRWLRGKHEEEERKYRSPMIPGSERWGDMKAFELFVKGVLKRKKDSMRSY